MWTSWPSPAKLNLFLRILDQRDDGYHNLQTVFRLLNWGDQVDIELRTDGVIERCGNTLVDLPAENDLAIRAACLLQQHTQKLQNGANIRVHKIIPAGGGFGGGSSNAATVLVALNALWDCQLTTSELAHLGLELGADVPVFVHGTNAWAEGVGNEITAMKLEKAWYLLVCPPVHSTTAKLFHDRELTKNARPATIGDFATGAASENAFEPVLRKREPLIDQVFHELNRFGKPRLTGTGSGSFIEFASRQQAQAAYEALPRDWKAWVVEGAEHSPLITALERYKQQGRRQEA